MGLLEVNKKTLFRIFLGVAVCIILYWLLNARESVRVVVDAGLDILSPFIIGGCLAFVLNVPMRYFENKLTKIDGAGMRRAVALLITLFAVLIVLGGVFLLLIPQLIETVEIFLPAVYDFLLELGVYIEKFLTESLVEDIESKDYRYLHYVYDDGAERIFSIRMHEGK